MRMRGGTAAVAASMGILGLCALPAGAAEVSVIQESSNKGPAPPAYVSFRAAGGEANAVTVTRDGGHYTVTDTGALLTPRGGCTRVDLWTASCTAQQLQVTLGDGDDSLVAPYGQAIDGGSGNDTIEAGGFIDAGDGDDVVRGGPGDDWIELGPGRDRGFGGAGDDAFGFYPPAMRPDRTSEPDEYDGGPGRDLLFYLSRGSAAMRLDLPAGIGGEDGENDRLVAMEGGSLYFGRLVGDGGANDLRAGARSVFTGAGGDDRITAGSRGQDRIDAGAGDDTVTLSGAWAFERRLPRRDELRCGPGADRVGLPAPNTIVPVDCEGASFGPESGPRVALARAASGAGSPLAIVSGGDCHHFGAKRCRVRATVHSVRRAERMGIPDVDAVIASGSAVFVRKRGGRVVLRPNRHGRAFLAGGRCRLANLTVTGLGRNGDQRVLFEVGRGCRSAPPL